MPRSTTEIANAIVTPKDGHMSRPTMAKPKPFVVSNISTNRYAPTTNEKQLPLRVPPPRSSKERPSVPRGVQTNQTSRLGSLPTVVPKAKPRRPSPKPTMMPAVNKTTKVQRSLNQTSRLGSLPTVVPKAEPRRPSAKPMMMPVANKTTKVQKPLPLHLAPSADRSFPEKTFVPKPLKVVQRLKEGKFIPRYPASVRSTQVTTGNEPPPRPSCVPRTRTDRSSVGVMAASKGKQDITIKVFTSGLRNPGIARQKLSVNIGSAKTAGRVKVTETSIKKSIMAVASGCRAGTPNWNWRLTPPKSIAYPHAFNVKPTSHVAWPPPPSPDLSSFPSQSWTIVVDVDHVKRIRTPTKICGDETLYRMCDVTKLSSAGRPKDSCERSESVSCSPALSSSPTVIETLESLAEPKIGSDGTVKISTPTKEPSAEVSHTVCAATIISPSQNGTASMDTFAKVMDRSYASSPIKVSDSGKRTPGRTMVHHALEIARTLFSPLRRTLQAATETADSKTMGTNVSRIRKLFIPPLDKDVKALKNPMMQWRSRCSERGERRRVLGWSIPAWIALVLLLCSHV